MRKETVLVSLAVILTFVLAVVLFVSSRQLSQFYFSIMSHES